MIPKARAPVAQSAAGTPTHIGRPLEWVHTPGRMKLDSLTESPSQELHPGSLLAVHLHPVTPTPGRPFIIWPFFCFCFCCSHVQPTTWAQAIKCHIVRHPHTRPTTRPLLGQHNPSRRVRWGPFVCLVTHVTSSTYLVGPPTMMILHVTSCLR
jgi:hypothetical protein